MSGPEKRQRLCTACKIHWDRDSGLSCPKCGAHPFFTCNADDIGTAMYFDQSGDSIRNYRPYVEESA